MASPRTQLRRLKRIRGEVLDAVAVADDVARDIQRFYVGVFAGRITGAALDAEGTALWRRADDAVTELVRLRRELRWPARKPAGAMLGLMMAAGSVAAIPWFWPSLAISLVGVAWAAKDMPEPVLIKSLKKKIAARRMSLGREIRWLRAILEYHGPATARTSPPAPP